MEEYLQDPIGERKSDLMSGSRAAEGDLKQVYRTQLCPPFLLLPGLLTDRSQRQRARRLGDWCNPNRAASGGIEQDGERDVRVGTSRRK